MLDRVSKQTLNLPREKVPRENITRKNRKYHRPNSCWRRLHPMTLVKCDGKAWKTN